MASWSSTRFALLLCMYLLVDVTQAAFDEEVGFANYILHDLPTGLASPFCADYVHYAEPTTTCTVTSAEYTVTSTVAPCLTSAEPLPTSWSGGYPVNDVITISSTTTITYTTTSTIWVAPVTPTAYKRAISPHEEEDNPPYDRATWCSDYSLPCRLVQYEPDVISAACSEYLGAGTATITSWASTTTVYETPACTPGYPAVEDGGYYGAPPADEEGAPADDYGTPEYGYDDGAVEPPDEMPAWLSNGGDDNVSAPEYDWRSGAVDDWDVEVPDEMPYWLKGGGDVSDY